MAPESHSRRHQAPSPRSLSLPITLWTTSGNASCIPHAGGQRPRGSHQPGAVNPSWPDSPLSTLLAFWSFDSRPLGQFPSPWCFWACAPLSRLTHGHLGLTGLPRESGALNLSSCKFSPSKKIYWSTPLLFSHSVMSDSVTPTDHSTPGFPVHHHLLELALIHVHQVSDNTQPSHPLSSPSPSAFNLSQHQGLSQ